MVEMVTIMVIKVDLQCCRCYKKIKKILCKFPQIRDQLYDEKNNTVTITVVCCSPEKIKQKICCKGGTIIKGIEIKPPPKPQPPQEKEKPKQEKPKLKDEEKPKPKDDPKPPVVVPPKPETKPTPPPVPVPIVCPPAPPVFISFGVCCGECYAGRPGGPCFHGHGIPIGTCCTECSEGRPGGPCFHGHERPAEPPANSMGTCCTECSEGRPGGPCFRGGYGGYGRPVYDSWGGGVCRSRCDYFVEENPSACTIM